MKISIHILYWAPRILCILAILFVSMFAGDAIEEGRTLWHNIGALLIHLIPTIILLSVLLVAWRYELIGGIILTIIGLAFSIFVFIGNFNRLHSVRKSLGIVTMICLPFVVAGILFIASHFVKNKEKIIS
jgi:hypothetical protein